MLFDTQIKGRMGSPQVAGSTSRLSAATSSGSASDTDRRPPPARRTRPFASGSPSRSSSPRLIVERARPLIFETSARPPRPALRASAAANNRRPRSSSRAPTVSHSQPNRRLVDHAIELRPFAAPRNPQHLSHPERTTNRPSRFNYCPGCP